MSYGLLYILKVTLFHGICYLIYWTLLRKLSHFSLNRIYLLITLIVGFIAPLILLPSVFPVIEPVAREVNVVAGNFTEVDSASSVLMIKGERNDVYGLALAVTYLAGVFILIARTILNIRYLRQVKLNGVEVSSSPRIFKVKETVSFVFINTIFLHESASPVVLLHERGHVEGNHWFDLTLLEITCIIFWVNPVVWLYRKSLRQQHEYLADDFVLRHGVSREDYLHCILNTLSIQEPIGPVHKFNSQSLKQRIIMMTRTHVKPYTKYLYLSLVPLLSLLFLSFSGTKEYVAAVDSQKVFVIDPAHGGNDGGATAASGLSEKEIALSLARLVQQIGEEKGLTIKLTRTSDQPLSLADRVKFSADVKADAFVSIHVGFDPDGAQKGLEVYVCKENRQYTDSKRIAGLLTGELDDVKEFNNPAVRNSGAYVLKHNHAPGAIIEAGFLSDSGNAGFIGDPANQRIVAAKIVAALMKY
jgi:N-acetylmuramoyl-L-alanine amidase